MFFFNTSFLRYSSAVTGWFWYFFWSWWYWNPSLLLAICYLSCDSHQIHTPPTVPCVHGPPSLHCTDTVDPVGKNGIISWVSVSTFVQGCLLIRVLWLFSSLWNNIGGLLHFCRKPLTGLLNSSATRLSKLGPSGVDLFCNKSISISISFKGFLDRSFYKLDACLCWPINLMIVQRLHCMMDV